MKKPDPHAAPRGTVLALGLDEVELFHRPRKGPEIYAAARAGAPTSAARAQTAQRLAKDHGLRPGEVDVLLAPDLLAHRIVSMPPLAPKELRQVCLRKAANLLELEEEQVTFSALQLRKSLETADDAERRWMILTYPKAEMRELAAELRGRGFRVRDLQFERFGCLGSRTVPSEDEDPGATLTVVAERGGISLTLLRGTDLVHQATLSGDPADAAFATVLIQEIRSLEGYWRKLSRGGDLQHLVLLGLPPKLADSLEPALRFAMPSANIHRSEPCNASPRIRILETALETHAFRFDLGVPVPARKQALVAVAVVAALIAGALGMEHAKRLTGENHQVTDEADRLLARMRDQALVEEQHRHMRAAVGTLEEERAVLAEIAGLGAPLEESLSQALSAFEGYGALTALSLETGDRGQTVSIAGTTLADPQSSLVALTGLVEALEQSPVYSNVDLLPPSSVNGPGEGSESARSALNFAVRGRWEMPR